MRLRKLRLDLDHARIGRTVGCLRLCKLVLQTRSFLLQCGQCRVRRNRLHERRIPRERDTIFGFPCDAVCLGFSELSTQFVEARHDEVIIFVCADNAVLLLVGRQALLLLLHRTFKIAQLPRKPGGGLLRGLVTGHEAVFLIDAGEIVDNRSCQHGILIPETYLDYLGSRHRLNGQILREVLLHSGLLDVFGNRFGLVQKRVELRLLIELQIGNHDARQRPAAEDSDLRLQPAAPVSSHRTQRSPGCILEVQRA